MRHLLIINLCFWNILLNAQSFTISGFISDSSSGERLIQASVYELSNQEGTASNNYGFFSITVPAGQVTLRGAYVGYTATEKSFILAKDTTVHLGLTPGNILEEVVITSAKSERIEEKVQMSQIDVPMKQIKATPALLGETDVLKVLQLLPGVKSGGEGQTGLYVRGGSPDQNLILLDGVPVYNVNHLAGFFSVFNADAINNVILTKGGFPARYGGRLSSIIDISMKEGNLHDFHGEGGIGLISSKLTLEGPIKKEKSSFLVSARRTYLDLLINPLIKAQELDGGDLKLKLNFYDLNAKVNYIFNDKNRLYISAYSGNDIFGFKEKYSYNANDRYESEAGINWGNLTTAIRWNNVISPKIFGNLTATYSRYNFNFSIENTDYYNNRKESFLSKYISGIRDFALKYSVDHIASSRHYLRYGLSATQHRYNPGVLQLRLEDSSSKLDTAIGEAKNNSLEYFAFAEDEMNFGRFTVNAGLHFSAFQLLDEENKIYTSLEPRLGLHYKINSFMAAKASYAQMKQYINLLTNEGFGLPSDLWVPSTSRVKPQSSWQVAAGVASTLWEDYELTVEGFYKEMLNVLSYNEDANFFTNSTNWEDEITQGFGHAYGMEILMQKKYGKLSGWVGYSLSWNWRKFPELNQGRRYPFKFDKRHDISVTASYQLNKKIHFSGTWVYSTGNAITLPENEYVGVFPSDYWINKPGYENIHNVPNIRDRNKYRMPAYHRLDLGVSFIKQKKKTERRWVIGIYNVYNRINPFAITSFENKKTGTTTFKYIGLFPVIPSVSYQFKF